LSLSRCSLGRLRPMLRSRLGSRRIGRVSNSLNLLARAEPVSVCTWPSKASVRGGMAGRPLPPHRPPLSGFFNGARVSVPAGGEDRASHRLREDGLTTLHTLMNPNVSWNHRGWDIETLSWYDDLRGVCYWGSQMQERGQHGRRGGCVTVGMTTWTVTYKRQYRRSDVLLVVSPRSDATRDGCWGCTSDRSRWRMARPPRSSHSPPSTAVSRYLPLGGAKSSLPASTPPPAGWRR
jgi:hypothetical protein